MNARVNRPGLAASLFVLAMGIGFFAWAQAYAPRTREVPALVAIVTMALALIDAAAQFDTTWGRFVRRFVSAKNIIEWKASGEEGAGVGRALVAIAWVVGYVAAVTVVGVYAATPIYVFFYMIAHGRKSVRASATASVVVTLALWVVFELAFRYTLYAGLLFGAD